MKIRGAGLGPPPDVAEQEPRAEEMIDQPGKVRRLCIAMIYSKPTTEQRYSPAMKILPEPPCLRRSGNPAGFEQARHVPRSVLIESHFLPSPQSTQLQRPILPAKSSDANIGSSSRHKPISRSGRCRRIQPIRYRYTSSRVERLKRSRPSSDLAGPRSSNVETAFCLPSLSSMSRWACG